MTPLRTFVQATIALINHLAPMQDPEPSTDTVDTVDFKALLTLPAQRALAKLIPHKFSKSRCLKEERYDLFERVVTAFICQAHKLSLKPRDPEEFRNKVDVSKLAPGQKAGRALVPIPMGRMLSP